MRELERKRLGLALVAAAAFASLSLSFAAAQLAPPMSLYGSVAHEDGPVEAGLIVRAYIGDVLCGAGETQYAGEGAGRITIYFVQVLSDEDRPGCGILGEPVRIQVGEEFAAQAAPWYPGPVQLHLTFGDVQPAAIPTSTPVPDPTIRGGVTTATPETGIVVVRPPAEDGFPLWIAVVAVLGGVGLAGTGLGWAMSRKREHDDDLFD